MHYAPSRPSTRRPDFDQATFDRGRSLAHAVLTRPPVLPASRRDRRGDCDTRRRRRRLGRRPHRLHDDQPWADRRRHRGSGEPGLLDQLVRHDVLAALREQQRQRELRGRVRRLQSHRVVGPRCPPARALPRRRRHPARVVGARHLRHRHRRRQGGVRRHLEQRRLLQPEGRQAEPLPGGDRRPLRRGGRRLRRRVQLRPDPVGDGRCQRRLQRPRRHVGTRRLREQRHRLRVRGLGHERRVPRFEPDRPEDPLQLRHARPARHAQPQRRHARLRQRHHPERRDV